MTRTSSALAAIHLSYRLASGRSRAERRSGRRSVPILNLHRVSSFRTSHRDTMEPAAFRALISGLQKSFRFVSLAEIDERLASGRNDEDITALTFDDAYACNYVYALPILRALNVPATFFVSSAFVDTVTPFPHDVRKGFADLPAFTSQQIREIAEDPLFEIGSHTRSHADFSIAEGRSRIWSEIVESRSDLERMGGRPVTRFAVPWGSLRHCTPEVIAAAHAAAYTRVYAHFGGRNVIQSSGEVGYVLHRIGAQGSSLYARACLEGYSGRRSFLPLSDRRKTLPSDFHPSDMYQASSSLDSALRP